MITSTEAIKLIKNLSIVERLFIAEEILKGIREEEMTEELSDYSVSEGTSEPAILTMSGIMDDEEAKIFDTAISEARKIDEDAW